MKKSKLIALIIGVLIFFVICCSFFSSQEMNNCNKFTSEYIKAFPTSKEIQNEIDLCTNIIINEKESFDLGFSTYVFRYLKDCWIFNLDNMAGKEAIVDSYYNEIVILRLKYLLVNEKDEEFVELFVSNYDNLNNCWLTTNYLLDLLYDNNYPVEYNDKQYKMIENVCLELLNNAKSDMEKYFALDSLINFYGSFNEAEEYYQKYSEERKNIIDAVGADNIKAELYKNYPSIG